MVMKKRLTLRMDGQLIAAAKLVAEQRGVSLSHMVAEYLESLTKNADPLPPITRSLAGILSPADFSREEYWNYLEKKHS